MALVAALLATEASAHVGDAGRLDLHLAGNDVCGTLTLPPQLVDLAVGVNADGDGFVSHGEGMAALPGLQAYVERTVTVMTDGTPCPSIVEMPTIEAQATRAVFAVPFRARCAGAWQALAIDYRVLAERDALHHADVRFRGGLVERAGTLVTGTGAVVLADAGDRRQADAVAGAISVLGHGAVLALAVTASVLCLVRGTRDVLALGAGYAFATVAVPGTLAPDALALIAATALLLLAARTSGGPASPLILAMAGGIMGTGAVPADAYGVAAGAFAFMAVFAVAAATSWALWTALTQPSPITRKEFVPS